MTINLTNIYRWNARQIHRGLQAVGRLDVPLDVVKADLETARNWIVGYVSYVVSQRAERAAAEQDWTLQDWTLEEIMRNHG